jgi:hypothetical protein
MSSKTIATIESDEKELLEASARPSTTIWRSLLAHSGVGPDAVLAQDVMEQMELECLAWRSRSIYQRDNNPAHHKCTMTAKAYSKRRAKNRMAKLSRRANRRRK